MKRAAKIGALLAGVLVLLLAGTLVWVVQTERGTRFAWSIAQRYLPATLEVGALDGPLAGPLTIENLAYHSDTMRLSLKQVSLEWDPGALFKGELKVQTIALSGLDYERISSPATVSSQPLVLPAQIALPVTIDIATFSLRAACLRAGADAKPFVIDALQFGASTGPGGLAITDFALDAPRVQLRGAARLAAARPYALVIELHEQLHLPDLAPLAGVSRIDGNLQQLQIRQSLEAPYSADLVATVTDPLAAVRFDASLNVQTIRLPAIRADLPAVTVSGTVHAGGVPTAITLAGSTQLEIPQTGPLTADFDGVLQQFATLVVNSLTVKSVAQPSRLTAHGQFAFAAAPAQISLDAEWQDIAWPLFSGAVPRVTSKRGAVHVAGALDDLAARVTAAIGEGGRLSGVATLRGDAFGLSLDWHDLAWPLVGGAPLVQSDIGSLAVHGRPDAYNVHLEGGFDAPGYAGGQVRLEGRGSRASLSITALDIAALRGQLSGNARVTWQPTLAAELVLDARGLDPAALLPEWPGRLNLRLDAGGRMQNGGLAIDARRLHVDGKLRGFAVRLDSKGGYAAGDIHIDKFTLASGSTRIEASGRIGGDADLVWQVHSPDLSNLLPAAAGSLTGSGSVQGSRAAPQIKAALHGVGLRYAQNRVRQFDLEAGVDFRDRQPLTLALALHNGQVAGVDIKSVTIDGTGKLADHRLRLMADASVLRADLSLQGHLTDALSLNRIWAFTLGRATLAYPALPAWSLAAPATGKISVAMAGLSRSCWRESSSTLCLTGSRDADATRAKVEIKALPFAYFAPLLSPDLTVDGTLGGSGTFRLATGAEPAAEVHLKTSAGKVASAGKALLAFQAGNVDLKLAAGGGSASVDLPLAGSDAIALQAQIAPGVGPLAGRPLGGASSVRIRNLEALDALIPQVEHLAGRLNGDVRLAGTLGAPVVTGQLTLTDGAVDVPEAGLAITDIRAALRGGGNGAVAIDATARSGAGTITVRGTSSLAAGATKADLRIAGQRFQVRNTGEVKVAVSPDLHVVMSDTGVGIEGEVEVPDAAIKPRKLPKSVQTVSADQVIIGADALQSGDAPAGRAVTARIKLVLGDRVTVDAFGLAGRLTGSLAVRDAPARPTTGTGELRIANGKFAAYGQDLDIEVGRLLFSGGPLSDPGVDVRAVRHTTADIEVGVTARGPLRQPDFTLFSNPIMSQRDQLAYLVLGRPATGGESAGLSAAAMALGLRGADYLTKQLGSRLNVDEIGVQAGSADNARTASLVIGKYLSPKLYVSYGFGLLGSISTLKLQYFISQSLKIMTENSAKASGGDLIYTIETGK